MSRFHGFFFVPMLFLLLTTTSPVTGRHQNPLVELSTRAELVELAGYGEEKLSSVLVTGTVSCEGCLNQQESDNYALPVSGVVVGISCKVNGRKKMKRRNWVEVEETTNEYGDFIIDLPSHMHAIQHFDKACFVKILAVPRDSVCGTGKTHIGRVKRIKFSSNTRNVRTYTAGNITLQQQTPACLMMINNKKRIDGDEDATW